MHWLLNPGLAFNELVLGQRLAKRMLIDESSDKPLQERSYVPCPHCGALNDGMLWSKKNGFGHWYGLMCPECEQIIPCMWNFTSRVLLAITFPIWFLPARALKPRWKNWQRQRMGRALVTPHKTPGTLQWLLIGTFGFGGFMWLLMSVLPHLLNKATAESMWLGLAFWLPGGFLWALAMMVFGLRKGKRSTGY